MGSDGFALSSSIPIWDQPLTDEELDKIDAAAAAAAASVTSPSSSRKRGAMSDPQAVRRSTRLRRLPGSLASSNFKGAPFAFTGCGGNIKDTYPVMSFEGRISYSQTTGDVEKAAAELLKKINMLKIKNGRVVLGFDIEWRPTFKKGCAPRKAALMQICCNSSFCYVMHIFYSGITPSLKLILEDDSVLKIGAGIANDAMKVVKDYNISIQGFKELSDFANKKLAEKRNWGLASLTEAVMHMEAGQSKADTFTMQLLKPKKVRLGNWEAAVLSEEKLHYAATDAFASWRLYHALDSLPDVESNVTKNEKQTLAVVTHC